MLVSFFPLLFWKVPQYEEDRPSAYPVCLLSRYGSCYVLRTRSQDGVDL